MGGLARSLTTSPMGAPTKAGPLRERAEGDGLPDRPRGDRLGEAQGHVGRVGDRVTETGVSNRRFPAGMTRCHASRESRGQNELDC
jgi:hypothetical protein